MTTAHHLISTDSKSHREALPSPCPQIHCGDRPAAVVVGCLGGHSLIIQPFLLMLHIMLLLNNSPELSGGKQ